MVVGFITTYGKLVPITITGRCKGETNYVIYIASTPGNYTSLNGSMTLHQVNERYWRINKPMEMFFANQPAESMPRKTDNKSL
jgi:E3 ubiquitin-protein ligase RNF1/2